MTDISKLGGSIGMQHNAGGRSMDIAINTSYEAAKDDFRLQLNARFSPQQGHTVETSHSTINPITGKSVEAVRIHRETASNTKLAAAVHVELEPVSTGIHVPGADTVTPAVSAGGAVNLTTGAAALGGSIQVRTDGDLTIRAGYQHHTGTAAQLQGPEISVGKDDADAYRRFIMGKV